MDFKALAGKRYSCRKYSPEVPNREILDELLETVRLAPSAVNFQPWKFIVIREKTLLEKIKLCYGSAWIQSAPVIIAACVNRDEAWTREDGKNHADIDAAIAIDHLTLAAAEKELGTCWVCKFDAREAESILDLPHHWEVVALIPIGYPRDDQPSARHQQRKSLDEIRSFDGF